MINETINKQKDFYQLGHTKPAPFRLKALINLKNAIESSTEEISLALKLDLNKSAFESYLSEIGIVLSEIEYAIKHVKKWMKPRKKRTPLPLFLAKSYELSEPLGVVLIMSPWNYPFQLAMVPLIGALAAGNTAVVKPASYAVHTSNVIKKILDATFEDHYVKTILGGREENTKLLDQPFDYIFFTGSSNVGKTVLEKASKNLTPVTLELGGKSPCIIDQDVNLSLTAKRIVFGKFLNAGQTCVAPDYVFIRENQFNSFVEGLKKAIHEFFKEKPLDYPDYPKIINERHLSRLIGLLKGEEIVLGGKYNETSLEPTILKNVKTDSAVMNEEIFGPILPVLFYKDIEEVYSFISTRPKPLALYLFSNDSVMIQNTFQRLSFGGATINDTVMHFASSEMGFGGVGASGNGRYHGQYSFDTFSNKRSIVHRSNLVDINVRYHPYTNKKLNLLKKLMK
ncbi:MAG: aldehyde dehydrogenase [Firmicutes bacterium]|nr:aldehyde dehydrogenase [Bacillota bacterium]